MNEKRLTTFIFMYTSKMNNEMVYIECHSITAKMNHQFFNNWFWSYNFFFSFIMQIASLSLLWLCFRYCWIIVVCLMKGRRRGSGRSRRSGNERIYGGGDGGAVVGVWGVWGVVGIPSCLDGDVDRRAGFLENAFQSRFDVVWQRLAGAGAPR